MSRRAFFSFHFERDVWRVNQVRNSWITRDREAAGFIDAAAFEEVKKGGEAAVHRWIDNNLHGTSVTVVCIGAETAQREYVRYEIQKSLDRGNGLLGVRIHNLKNVSGQIDFAGANPFLQFTDNSGGWARPLSDVVPVYDWVSGNGYVNLGSWVEAAAAKAGR
jgi:antiphage defense system Thoeris ThsB-like protein